MAIFLDTNALPLEARASALSFSVVRAIAKESGHELLVPSVALEEATAKRQRDLTEAIKELRASRDQLRRLGVQVSAEVADDPADLAAEWQRELESCVTIIPTELDDYREGILREVRRIPPARDGKGARDAAIWLTVLRARRQRSDTCFFLTNNTKDFSDPNNRTALHPALAMESASNQLLFCASSSALLELLAKKLSVEVESKALTSSQGVNAAVIQAVSRPGFLRKIALQDTATSVFVAGPVDAVLDTIKTHEAFQLGSSTVLVAWTRWKVSFTLGALSSYGNNAFAQELRRVDVEGDFQIWAKRANDAASWSTAEVNAVDNMALAWGAAA